MKIYIADLSSYKLRHPKCSLCFAGSFAIFPLRFTWQWLSVLSQSIQVTETHSAQTLI